MEYGRLYSESKPKCKLGQKSKHITSFCAWCYLSIFWMNEWMNDQYFLYMTNIILWMALWFFSIIVIIISKQSELNTYLSNRFLSFYNKECTLFIKQTSKLLFELNHSGISSGSQAASIAVTPLKYSFVVYTSSCSVKDSPPSLYLDMV